MHMRRSSEQEFIRLMDTYSRLLTGLCVVTLRDVHLAQDVVQETFLRAWRKGPLRPDTEKAWLTRVAMNLCRDQLRRGWMRRIDRSIPFEELVIPVEPQDNDVIREVYALPPKERQIIVMHYWGNLSVQEIAAALRISRASVYRTMDKAKAHLRIQLSETDEKGDAAHD